MRTAWYIDDDQEMIEAISLVMKPVTPDEIEEAIHTAFDKRGGRD